MLREYWKLGGPVLAVLGIAGILLTGNGIFELALSETGKRVLSGQVSNYIPFFLQVFAYFFTGVILIIVSMYFFFRLKKLELEKDLKLIEVLEKTSADITNVVGSIYGRIQLLADKGGFMSSLDNSAQELLKKQGEILTRIDNLIKKKYSQ